MSIYELRLLVEINLVNNQRETFEKFHAVYSKGSEAMLFISTR